MVTERKLLIIWDTAAKTQLRKAYNEIKKESLQGAETVRDGIIESVDELPENPTK